MHAPDSIQSRWARERAFHDALAAELEPSSMPAARPVVYDEVVLRAAGIDGGTRVLDLGCGHGDLTLALLRTGADVTGIDVSPGMVEVARQRVAMFGEGREAAFVAGPFEQADFQSASFDVVVGRWILHHLDLNTAIPEVARVLAPGGRMVFLENSGANPVLNLARRHVVGRCGIPRFGTVDERPMNARDWSIIEAHLASVRREYPIVEIFGLLDRQIFRYRRPRFTRICESIDAAFARRDSARRFSYRVLVIGETAAT